MAYRNRTSLHLPMCQVTAFPKAIGAGLKANTQVLTGRLAGLIGLLAQ